MESPGREQRSGALLGFDGQASSSPIRSSRPHSTAYVRLGAALLAGALIGFEEGRPGFELTRLSVLAMLMLVPVYQATWLGIPVDQNFSAKSESRDPRHHDRHRLPWSPA